MKKFNLYSQLKANFPYVFIIGIIIIEFIFLIALHNEIINYKCPDSSVSEIISPSRSYNFFKDIISGIGYGTIIFLIFYCNENNDKKAIFDLENKNKVLIQTCYRLRVLDLRSHNSQKTLNDKLRGVNNIARRLIDKLREVGRNDLEINDFLEEIEEDYDLDYFTPDDIIPIKCLKCKYYSYNKLLKCAVNPDLPENCQDFEAGEQ
jgi:hypothetical protein